MAERLILDSKLLANRFKQHELTTNKLISNALHIQRKLEAIKLYNKKIEELNEMAKHRPKSYLIYSLAQENCQIRDLQQDNKELKQCLDEYKNALEIVIHKYREQVTSLIKNNQLEQVYLATQANNKKELVEKKEKVEEMLAVIQFASLEEDDYQAKESANLLTRSNNSIKHLLNIDEGTHERSDENIS